MGYCYLLANKQHGTIYVGVTNLLERRILEHKNELYNGFSKKYGCKLLVWYQEFSSIQEAISYEKKIKGWTRKKKIALIENENKQRVDLFYI